MSASFLDKFAGICSRAFVRSISLSNAIARVRFYEVLQSSVLSSFSVCQLRRMEKMPRLKLKGQILGNVLF